ncbi:hypothetical protein [Roseomonas genomospecies 6]|uniref:Uncharacterized protein n=1 Tax=Roseomonas genomospecies 6 TaxID=214106 RepID=A0A9W7KRA4_9PROT|nr:hypothetical protein [Roseomonas genomospecies 6]KAA0677624.1 hypothetical protein DS843_22555 [Roseomonas genomospecies 6]
MAAAACLTISFSALAAEEATPPQASGEACIEAAKQVEKEKGLPPGLLWGLSLNETGRIGPDGRFGPAPAVVTAGMNKKGGINSWDFSGNPEKAKAKAREILAQKKTNIDIGCWQHNWKWHGDKFASFDDYLAVITEPVLAARMAADQIVANKKILEARHGKNSPEASWLQAGARWFRWAEDDLLKQYQARLERNWSYASRRLGIEVAEIAERDKKIAFGRKVLVAALRDKPTPPPIPDIQVAQAIH